MGMFGKKPEETGTSGWQITCDATCGFMVRDYDRKELVQVIQLHMATSHHQAITETDALRMASAVADEV